MDNPPTTLCLGWSGLGPLLKGGGSLAIGRRGRLEGFTDGGWFMLGLGVGCGFLMGDFGGEMGFGTWWGW